MRAVSLVPSITETLRAWGLDPVACTRYCEQPDLLHVGGTKNPDLEAIAALQPDVVLLDKVENRKEDAEALEARGLVVVALNVERLGDVPREMAVLAETVRLPAALAEACAVSPLAAPETEESTMAVFVPIWRRPWMTIGANTYGSTLLEHLGARNVYKDAQADFPEVTLDDVQRRSPDLILVPSEPYEFEDRHLSELADIAPVQRLDGQDLFWWGARTPGALERLSTSIENTSHDRNQNP